MLPIAVAQFAPTSDKKCNADKISDHVRSAAEAGARVIVLPEFAMFSVPGMDERFLRSAEPLSGQFVRSLGHLAAAHTITIVCGFNETSDDPDRIHNTLVAINEDGRIAATYRKVHLYDAFGYTESTRVRPGKIDKPELFEVDGIRFGMQTCYDVRFPEVTRRIVDAGADVLLLPAAWVPGPLKEDHWSTLVRARAIENTMYVAACGQTAPGGVGRSTIVDPMGVQLASLGEADGVAVAEVSADRIAEVRATNPALELRRFAVIER
ncbi:carbon-nitrogen hydrolase family protein [Saccharopolyspora sp. ASAGF58]|uniref:carbon-nitrogen hydrolase family protein n=1 Tax=Saccharopolyspora sp. ASAGF58 TaxID=2719023 RepID=UPI00143FD685|nr:carbon-nitrogen hydrolase family protein [Saccharopolyspora sp. ASAGF58]QIZ37379.1 carbon-nitrogen hydrolase family protein [Saccharopolyspora sp. ASAGF58]